MTKLLLKLFVKNRQDTNHPKVRSAVGVLSGVTGVICNILLFAMKLAVGTISGSVAITADAMNNLSDATSAIVTLVGFKLAEKPADEDHPYGHARYEYLSGLAVAAMIIVIGFELAKSSVGKILHPTEVLFDLPVCIVLLGSIAVKLWLCLFNRKLGRMVESKALLATAADSRNDVISTGAVFIAGVLGTATGWMLDGYMGLGVALFILYSGAMLARETISPLLGENASPELRGFIVDVLRSQPEVLGYHDLMVHDYGPGQRFASVHVEMDQRLDALVCHELIDNLERMCLNQHNVHLVIHYDPVAIGDETHDRLFHTVQSILKEQDARISIHDFRMVKGEGHTNLIFDIALPSELMVQRKQIKKQMDARLAELEENKFYTVVTFDIAAFN